MSDTIEFWPGQVWTHPVAPSVVIFLVDDDGDVHHLKKGAMGCSPAYMVRDYLSRGYELSAGSRLKKPVGNSHPDR